MFSKEDVQEILEQAREMYKNPEQQPETNNVIYIDQSMFERKIDED